MPGLFVSITFISALAGHIATSIPTWECAVRLFAARAIEAVNVNQPTLAMTLLCQTYPDWSKTNVTSTPSRLTAAIGGVAKWEVENKLGKTTALAQKKKALTIGRPLGWCVGVCS